MPQYITHNSIISNMPNLQPSGKLQKSVLINTYSINKPPPPAPNNSKKAKDKIIIRLTNKSELKGENCTLL